MELALSGMSLLILTVLSLKTVAAFLNYRTSREYVKIDSEPQLPPYIPFILLVVPVLREQSVIAATLESLTRLIYPSNRFSIIVVGTAKEVEERALGATKIADLNHACASATDIEKVAECIRGILPRSMAPTLFERRGQLSDDELSNVIKCQPSTGQIVTQWTTERSFLQYSELVPVMFLTCPDAEGGRAAQLNYAVEHFLANGHAPDIIGIYDADSRPEPRVLLDVACTIPRHSLAAAQQPLHYLNAAEALVSHKAHPVVVANALYQTTWSLIRELPRLIHYRTHTVGSRRDRVYPKTLYMNGHGEFLTRELYHWLGGFPSGVTTDGIQLGYRLSLTGIPIFPLRYFCGDDVPTTLLGIVRQHKRWYAGNLEFFEARRWASRRGYKLSTFALADNIALNATWAFRPVLFLCGLAAALVGLRGATGWSIACGIVFACLSYCYLLPILAIRLLRRNLGVRVVDIVCLPLAICLKSLGPWVFIAAWIRSSYGRAGMSFEKVER